jgi:peptidoglycan/LPS O-acetylase OafA/YrhL
MFGYLRFFLATMVLFSHFEYDILGLHLGVIAVVLFYMLAGYVVTDLMTRVFEPSSKLLWRFYAERCLRIFPLYLYCTGLTILFLLLTHFGQPAFSLKRLGYHFLVVPLNYYTLFDGYILQNPRDTLIPTAWSLGAELQAYLLLPLVLRFKLVKLLTTIASLFIFSVATIGGIYPEQLGYRLLCGTFFMFVLGSCLYKHTKYPKWNEPSGKIDGFDRVFLGVGFGICLLCFIVSSLLGNLAQDYSMEVLTGVLLGVPILYWTSSNSIRLPLNTLLGDLSYGIFLSHFLAKWSLMQFYPTLALNSLTGRCLALFLSAVISLPGIFLIEKPIFIYRKALARPSCFATGGG